MKYISEEFLQLEKKYNLLEWKIDNIYIWQSVRVYIFEYIISASNKKNNKSNITIKHLCSLVFSIVKRFFVNIVLLNPILDNNKTDILIFESGRKEKVDGDFIDIYTKYICDIFQIENKKFTVYSLGIPLRKLKYSFRYNKSLDFISLISRITSMFVNNRINESSKQIKLLEKEFSEKFNLKLNLNQILEKELKRFKSQYIGYRILFKYKKPKEIYIVGSGYKAPLIKSAKDLNILVNELQHGLLIKESIISNFPYSKPDSIEYFPNVFFKWKDLNMCSAYLPLSKTNIKSFPNYHLNYMLKRYENRVRKNNQITVISQPFIGHLIFDYVKENLLKMENWKIIYKFHPGENQDDYVTNKINLNNINFVKSEISIYELFSESNIVIGVFSTALFEAKYFGCKIILINLPGVEYVESLLNDKDVIKINIGDIISNKINKLISK